MLIISLSIVYTYAHTYIFLSHLPLSLYTSCYFYQLFITIYIHKKNDSFVVRFLFVFIFFSESNTEKKEGAFIYLVRLSVLLNDATCTQVILNFT